MEGNAACLILSNNNTNNYSNFISTSTGYLEDALLEMSVQFKRRRLMVSSTTNNDHLHQYHHHPLTTPFTHHLSYRNNWVTSYNELSHASVPVAHHHKLNSSGNMEMKNKRLNRTRSIPTKMVYPFGLVKPGGEEGDITLNDINRRILMPPTRPLKHPVGNFAYRSNVSTNGPGLSGKAVVGLTKIHTRGRGTITIIRTKG